MNRRIYGIIRLTFISHLSPSLSRFLRLDPALLHGPPNAGSPDRGVRQREGESIQGENLVLRLALKIGAFSLGAT